MCVPVRITVEQISVFFFGTNIKPVPLFYYHLQPYHFQFTAIIIFNFIILFFSIYRKCSRVYVRKTVLSNVSSGRTARLAFCRCYVSIIHNKYIHSPSHPLLLIRDYTTNVPSFISQLIVFAKSCSTERHLFSTLCSWKGCFREQCLYRWQDNTPSSRCRMERVVVFLSSFVYFISIFTGIFFLFRRKGNMREAKMVNISFRICVLASYIYIMYWIVYESDSKKGAFCKLLFMGYCQPTRCVYVKSTVNDEKLP